MGADIAVLPTNWPEGKEKNYQYVVNTRALENRVNLVAVDRVGTENGARFIGHSKIVGSTGDTLAEASGNLEETIYAEIDIEHARRKFMPPVPGDTEVNFLQHRRPELYGEITELSL